MNLCASQRPRAAAAGQPLTTSSNSAIHPKCQQKDSVVQVGTMKRPKCLLDMARILIVDTQTELRHDLVRLLEQAGHHATAVATVQRLPAFSKTMFPTCWQQMSC
jgi:hypothetical protein